MTSSHHIEIVAAPGSADPTPEEAAAITAAIASLMGGVEQPPAEPASRWRGSAALIGQGLAPARTPAAPRWATIERIRRAGGGGGIVGL